MRWMRAVLTVAATFVFTTAVWAKIDTVRITDFAFVPASLTILPGDTVVWKSIEECCSQHTTTRSTGPMTWNATVPLNGAFRLAFNQQGTFNYVCIPHADLGMTGAIAVFTTAPSLGWAGLALLLASLGSAGIWIVRQQKELVEYKAYLTEAVLKGLTVKRGD